MSAAVAGQIILSAANFFIGFLLIRHAGDKTYGLYILLQSGLMFLTSTTSSIITGPLSVLLPARSVAERRDMASKVRHDQSSLLLRLLPLALLLTLAAYGLGFIGRNTALLAGVAAFAGWTALRRELFRGVLLACSLVHGVLVADTAYAVVLVLAILATIILPLPAELTVPLALALAAWLGGRVACAQFARNPGWGDPKGAAHAWSEIRPLAIWTLSGTMIFWVFAQSYNYILAIRLDLSAVADVNAARLIMMPMVVITVGLGNILPPMAGNWYAEVGYAKLVRRLLLYVLLPLSVLYVVYSAVIWIISDWVIATVLRTEIHDHERLILLWALLALAGLVRDVIQSALFATGRLKFLTQQIAFSTVIALLVMTLGIPHWGAAAALIGQITGEVVNIIGLLIGLRTKPPLRPAQV
jgi:O-antigen/teichoic acid export membrane protein